jgi:hypothetical protein
MSIEFILLRDKVCFLQQEIERIKDELKILHTMIDFIGAEETNNEPKKRHTKAKSSPKTKKADKVRKKRI